MKAWLILLIFLGLYSHLIGEENFILVGGHANRVIRELGTGIDTRVTPCSTFKIALSLMGFDAKVLSDAQSPVREFQEGYDDFLESWKLPQTPQSWMKCSCIWYSKILALQLGTDTIQNYLNSIAYGNCDLTGELTQLEPTNPVWVNSSLKISPKEQVEFLRKMISKEIAFSNHSIEMTKSILFIEELSHGWKLFGKTGWGGSVKNKDGLEIAWFVGWIEKNQEFFPFAYNIYDSKIDLTQRIPRAKELLKESMLNVFQENSSDTQPDYALCPELHK